MDKKGLEKLEAVLDGDAVVSESSKDELEAEGDIRYLEVITQVFPRLLRYKLDWQHLLAKEVEDPRPGGLPRLKILGEAELSEGKSIIYFEDINSSASVEY